jgi:hypothetical protein
LGDLWPFSTCTGAELASSTHASATPRHRPQWIPRRKEISLRCWRRYQHATSPDSCKLPRDFSALQGVQGARRLLSGLVERSVGLDLHRIWEREALQASRVGVGSGRARFQPRLVTFPPTFFILLAARVSIVPTRPKPHSDRG